MDYFNQESKRLRFRALTENDETSWIDFFEGNDGLHFLGLDGSKSKELMAKEWITKQLDRYKTQDFGLLAVETKDTGEFIGMGGILPRELDGNHEYEVAYSLKPAYWGKGYGTEMAQQMKHYAKENIDTDRFISIIHKDNIGSINVAKKNGMVALFTTEFLGMEVVVYGITK